MTPEHVPTAEESADGRPELAAAALSPRDMTLLREHEPVLRFNRGELFYPMAVQGYLAECDLLAGTGDKDRRTLVPHGEVTPRRLATAETTPGESLYLRFVQQPMGRLDLARWRVRPEREIFHAPGRLARVGLFARLVDAGFTASLLLRGTVPGGTAAAAAVKYQAIRASDPRYVYHARVLRQDGWIILHYVFFYAMNDFRSTFAGANDHEADWEQLFVFLDDDPGGPVPTWVACAAHDYTGDELRRRWDDPALEKQGTHPVINPGGGSHAAYFETGDYLTVAPIPGISRLRGPLALLRRFWRDTLRQPDPGDLSERLEGALNVGFIDYGRGNGRVIGPGGDGEWTPVPIGDDVDWVDGYRGLFGLDTHDRFAGERAPAGPKYNRDGTVRQTWHDPLGWSGLDKVAPPSRAGAVLDERIEEIRGEVTSLEQEIEAAGNELRARDLLVRATAGEASLVGIHERSAAELAEAEAAQVGRRLRQVELEETARAASVELERIRTGDWGDPRAHLHHEHHPIPPEESRYGRLVELWSAVSVALLLAATVLLVYFGILSPIGTIVVVAAAYAFVDAALRRQLLNLMLALTVLLAIIGALVLAVTYATQLLVIALIALALVILVDNVRELRAG